jgi:hypothetical protein
LRIVGISTEIETGHLLHASESVITSASLQITVPYRQCMLRCGCYVLRSLLSKMCATGQALNHAIMLCILSVSLDSVDNLWYETSVQNFNLNT